ncbi:MAG: VOC family protein [Syntrophorhabdales bacterium]|jgi:methylmalonyl-CoA epimerase
MSLKLDHVGHVVKDLDEARKFYEEKLGLAPKLTMSHPEFGSRMVFYPFANIELELIRPGNMPGDYAGRCLKERGEGVFHLSFVPDDYEAEVKAWREKGFTVEEIAVEEARGPVRLAFLRPEETHGLWIEFVDATNLSSPPSK